jgi:hypothetical protein
MGEINFNLPARAPAYLGWDLVFFSVRAASAGFIGMLNFYMQMMGNYKLGDSQPEISLIYLTDWAGFKMQITARGNNKSHCLERVALWLPSLDITTQERERKIYKSLLLFHRRRERF